MGAHGARRWWQTVTQPSAVPEPRVIIVADSASARFGGEAILPLHYYRVLRRRGVPVWLVVHERTRAELTELFGADDHIHYVPDTRGHLLAWQIGQRLPARVSYLTTGTVLRLLTQRAQKKVLRQLVSQHGANLIHQPTPVSPKEPSLMRRLGTPVIFGPMNGGMQFPPAFRALESRFERAGVVVGRALSGLVNRLLPGKHEAALLLVANPRTRAALPAGMGAPVMEFVENGVDLSKWGPAAAAATARPAHTRYVFLGRLVKWKAVDLLLRAFAQASQRERMSLQVVGDGDERAALEALARQLGVWSDQAGEPGRVYFAGWQAQAACTAILRSSDALVLPSMFECGGAVVLEAMACGLPVIATRWGGPADYLDEQCGILIEPDSPASFIDNLALALAELGRNAPRRQAMGEAGRAKIAAEYDWEVKVNRMLAIYRQVLARPAAQ